LLADTHKMLDTDRAGLTRRKAHADTTRAGADLARFGGTIHSADLSSDQLELAGFQARLDQATQGAAATGHDDR